MLEVGQLEDLGRDGGQTVAVETENLQTAGQVGEAARLQPRDAVVVQEAARQNATNGLSQERDASGPDSIYDPPPRDTHRFLSASAGKELALMSPMALLLRSSVSRLRKGSSCSAEIPAIRLFALKTHTHTCASVKQSHARKRRHFFAACAEARTNYKPTLLLPGARRPFGFPDVLFCLLGNYRRGI